MPKTMIAVLVGLVCAGGLFAAAGDLRIYWIDAEGSAATLIVSPSGE